MKRNLAAGRILFAVVVLLALGTGPSGAACPRPISNQFGVDDNFAEIPIDLAAPITPELDAFLTLEAIESWDRKRFDSFSLRTFVAFVDHNLGACIPGAQKLTLCLRAMGINSDAADDFLVIQPYASGATVPIPILKFFSFSQLVGQTWGPRRVAPTLCVDLTAEKDWLATPFFVVTSRETAVDWLRLTVE